LSSDYAKGQQYGVEALQFATESGHQCQIAHALSLLALHAFCQGDYTTCQDYAERSRTFIKDIMLLVIQPYSLALLILLACLREDYAEAVRLNELAKRHSTNTMGFQLFYWALAAVSCGLGRPADARLYIQKALQLSDPHIHAATTIWLVPCAAYALVDTDPETAVELLAWVLSYPDTALSWARCWRLVERLQAQLQAVVDGDSYRMHWEKGSALTFDAIATTVYHAFPLASDTGAEAAHQLLTAREHEILRLLAAGMTNPQIAAQLVIGAGTVKTHTLNIYRKLEVVNRTQAIVRAQELGLLGA
jgi:ATP/maltotriose-dependent transcriptional regulator MalT